MVTFSNSSYISNESIYLFRFLFFLLMSENIVIKLKSYLLGGGRLREYRVSSRHMLIGRMQEQTTEYRDV